MRSRGPRGLATGRPLKPIAWGEVAWSASAAYWTSQGGEFVSAPTTSSTTTTVLQLARPHEQTRIFVQLTPHAAADDSYDDVTDVREVRESRTDGTITVRTLSAEISRMGSATSMSRGQLAGMGKLTTPCDSFDGAHEDTKNTKSLIDGGLRHRRRESSNPPCRSSCLCVFV